MVRVRFLDLDNSRQEPEAITATRFSVRYVTILRIIKIVIHMTVLHITHFGVFVIYSTVLRLTQVAGYTQKRPAYNISLYFLQACINSHAAKPSFSAFTSHLLRQTPPLHCRGSVIQNITLSIFGFFLANRLAQVCSHVICTPNDIHPQLFNYHIS